MGILSIQQKLVNIGGKLVNIFSPEQSSKDYREYVYGEGGTIENFYLTDVLVKHLKDAGLWTNTELLFDIGLGGRLERVDGVLKFVRFGYDISPNPSAPYFPSNDLDGSATASQQPRLVGGIAPGSKAAASNQSGESRSFSHEAITVSGTYTTVKMMDTGGKYEFTYTEVTSGTLSTVTWTGNLRIYMIYAGTLSAADRTSLEAFLYGIYPEIESVDIGTQTWATRNFEAVATPEGNVIANVTENGAVEKIVNGNNEAAVLNISGIRCNVQQSTDEVYAGTYSAKITINEDSVSLKYIQSPSLVVGKYYSIDLWYYLPSGQNNTSLIITGNAGLVISSLTITDEWTNVKLIWKATSTNFRIRFIDSSAGLIGEHFYLDNVSVQELNWANATTIYDAVYAATAGTNAQKEYAALKEAAFWCYYNNDVNNGAIYGKLYNWYAAKLLDLDMVTANFGWRVPTSAQFTTLATYLGGASVAGGKMKMTGLDYWNTPNTGATNESGFTSFGCGFRSVAGSSISLGARLLCWGVESANFNSPGFILRSDQATIFLVENDSKIQGGSIRLIKHT